MFTFLSSPSACKNKIVNVGDEFSEMKASRPVNLHLAAALPQVNCLVLGTKWQQLDHSHDCSVLENLPRPSCQHSRENSRGPSLLQMISFELFPIRFLPAGRGRETGCSCRPGPCSVVWTQPAAALTTPTVDGIFTIWTSLKGILERVPAVQ